jgi:hypothetical protein
VTPRWRADGKELYFLAPDATLMAVPVTAAGTSSRLARRWRCFRPCAWPRRRQTRIVDGGTEAAGRPQYAVARDGRFLINQSVGTPPPCRSRWS